MKNSSNTVTTAIVVYGSNITPIGQLQLVLSNKGTQAASHPLDNYIVTPENIGFIKAKYRGVAVIYIWRNNST